MGDLLGVFDLDPGELVESGFQLIVAVLFLVLGVVLMLAELVVDGVLLWGILLFVAGLVVGVLAVGSFLDAFF